MSGNKYGRGQAKGYQHSDEAKEKMKNAKLKRPTKYWLGKKRPKMTGEMCPWWKGGISKEKYGEELLERIKFRQTIQKKVFNRDNYTCQLCGERGGNIQVDHIQPWAEYVELRFDINNCRTLCMNCHYEITFGKKKPQDIKIWGHNFNQIGSELKHE